MLPSMHLSSAQSLRLSVWVLGHYTPFPGENRKSLPAYSIYATFCFCLTCHTISTLEGTLEDMACFRWVIATSIQYLMRVDYARWGPYHPVSSMMAGVVQNRGFRNITILVTIPPYIESFKPLVVSAEFGVLRP